MWKSVLRSALNNGSTVGTHRRWEKSIRGEPKIMEIETPRRQKHNVITGKYYIINVNYIIKMSIHCARTTCISMYYNIIELCKSYMTYCSNIF